MSFIELKQVEFSYPRQKSPAVTDINLKLEKEVITAVVGPNGSGKTTLTRLIIGILPPDRGEIYLAGLPLSRYSLAQVGARIGYIFQNPDLQLFCRSVAEEMAFGLSKSGQDPQQIKEKVDFFLEYFELDGYRNSFPMHLSQGEKQRLAIAAVMAHEPEYLILDEPTIGMDAFRKQQLVDYLHKMTDLGRGMLLVSHDMAFIDKLAERLISMEKGRIQSDRVKRKNV
ncbi:MAG: ABC transporter ATP-binding protein [Syntrophomonadaceae bacterium]|nr:ABC transporter ATP-binding protein [Syntrophomonadaceae bacterium]